MFSMRKIDEVSYCFDFTLGASEIFNGVRDRLAWMASRNSLPGFRDLHHQNMALEKIMGHQIRQEVIQELLTQAFRSQAEACDLDVIGRPDFKWHEGNLGGDNEFRFTATFETYPRIDLEAYRGIEVEVPVCDVGMTFLDAQLEELREKFAQWIPHKRVTRSPQRVIVDVALFAGARLVARKRRVEILCSGAEERAFVSEYEALAQTIQPALDGARVGEALSMELTAQQKIRLGNAVPSAVTALRVYVTKILEKQPLTDDRALLHAAGFGRVPGLDPWNEFKHYQEERISDWAGTVFFNNLVRALVDRADFPLPERMLDDVFQSDLSRSRRSLRRVDADPVALEISELLIRRRSRERLILELISHHFLKTRGESDDHGGHWGEGIPFLLAWAEQACRFRPIPMEPDQLQTTNNGCPEELRRMAHQHDSQIARIVRQAHVGKPEPGGERGQKN